MHMGAAAEFDGEVADGEHAHEVGVFFAEQGHGAGGDGFVVVHHAYARFGIGADLLIDHRFDGAELCFAECLVVREVKAQLVRRNQRAFLRDMAAEHPAECSVQ